MKKTVGVMLAAAALVAFALYSYSRPASFRNSIAPSKLSADQQDIVDLLLISGKQELCIFDFVTDKPYSSIDVWVEVYKDGEIIEYPAGVSVHSDTAEKRAGRVTIVSNENDSTYQWTLSVLEDGGKSSHIGTTEIIIEPALARFYGAMVEPANIENGKEIIIYSSLFSGESLILAFDCQTLEERPELLKDYPYAHLVKCKFTK